METNYYQNLDENFKEALKLFENNQSHQCLIEYLKNGNIPQRQISAIKLDCINSKEEAQILISNLTGQDGKIREVVSYRIAEFTTNSALRNYFKSNGSYDKFLDALTDINGNICRNTLKIINNFISEKDFIEYFIPKLCSQTESLAIKVLSLGNQDGKYKINKDSFKLYWCLEAIYILGDLINSKNLLPILLKAKDVQDYTIREKVAKILTLNFDDSLLTNIKNELKNDSNYYVNRY